MKQIFLGFFKKELIQTLRDPRMRVLLLVAPVLQLTLFGLAISTEIRNVRLAAVAAPNDFLMERLVNRCYSSKWFLRADMRGGTDPFRWVQSGQADAVLIAPDRGLTRAVGRGKAQIQLLVDSSNIIKAQAIEAYLQAISNRVLSEAYPDAPAVSLVNLSVWFLYNPEMNTSWFMVPSVLCLILCLVTILMACSSLAKEKETGTFETLIASPATTTEILLGKSLPYVVLGMADVPLVVGVAVFGFGVPLRGSFWTLFLAALVFMCNTVAIGVLLSTFVRNMQQAIMGAFLVIFPSIMLSGVIYPVENMPAALKVTAYLDPLQYFVTLLRNIMLKGGDAQVVAVNITALAVMGVLAIYISTKRFHQTLN